MWQQLKQAIADCAREVCFTVRVEKKNQKNCWQNGEIKSALERKLPTWKDALGAMDGIVKKKV